MKKYFSFAPMAVIAMALMTTACSKDDDAAQETQQQQQQTADAYLRENATNPVNTDFTERKYGTQAIADCADIVAQMESANSKIEGASLTEEQTQYLREVLGNIVDNVIVPTYTKLADNTETLEQTLRGLEASTITQAQINEACRLFGEARVQWERSEAFLGGAASDFSVDPTIDSWPLSRTALHTYLTGSMNPEDLDDESILGFHALEFILFRNGQPRKVAEFKSNDTYNGFTNVAGSKELVYAQQVCKLLKERTFQLQVAWQGECSGNAGRVAVVKAANLGITTEKGLSYGDDLKQAGTANSKYSTIKSAIAQVLSDEEGSAAAIANEVGTAKIANPFRAGEISYVESPYSYRSIIDFQDNIRSVRNVWCGNVNGSRDESVKSFWSFFRKYGQEDINVSVVNSYVKAINSIGSMPAPFVKYCCTVWNKEFSEEEYSEEE